MRWGATSKVRCRWFATGDASVNLHPSGAETDSFGYDSEATPPEALPDDASPCPVQVGAALASRLSMGSTENSRWYHAPEMGGCKRIGLWGGPPATTHVQLPE